MDCICCSQRKPNQQLMQKLQQMESELADTGRRILNVASDPFSAVIKLLHERPEGSALPGMVINKALLEVFGEPEKIPSLVRILAAHVREIIRQSNVITLINEHPVAERWGNFIIKQTERIKFEVSFEKGMLVLRNINGLIGVEHGMELPLEKILVSPPNKLIVTVKMGILRPEKVVDM